VVDTDDGVLKFSLLWTSPEFVDEIGGDVPKKKLRLTGKTPSTAEKHTSCTLQKSLTPSYDTAIESNCRVTR
jgi:hypothetical protein